MMKKARSSEDLWSELRVLETLLAETCNFKVIEERAGDGRRVKAPHLKKGVNLRERTSFHPPEDEDYERGDLISTTGLGVKDENDLNKEDQQAMCERAERRAAVAALLQAESKNLALRMKRRVHIQQMGNQEGAGEISLTPPAQSSSDWALKLITPFAENAQQSFFAGSKGSPSSSSPPPPPPPPRDSPPMTANRPTRPPKQVSRPMIRSSPKTLSNKRYVTSESPSTDNADGLCSPMKLICSKSASRTKSLAPMDVTEVLEGSGDGSGSSVHVLRSHSSVFSSPTLSLRSASPSPEMRSRKHFLRQEIYPSGATVTTRNNASTRTGFNTTSHSAIAPPLPTASAAAAAGRSPRTRRSFSLPRPRTHTLQASGVGGSAAHPYHPRRRSRRSIRKGSFSGRHGRLLPSSSSAEACDFSAPLRSSQVKVRSASTPRSSAALPRPISAGAGTWCEMKSGGDGRVLSDGNDRSNGDRAGWKGRSRDWVNSSPGTLSSAGSSTSSSTSGNGRDLKGAAHASQPRRGGARARAGHPQERSNKQSPRPSSRVVRRSTGTGSSQQAAHGPEGRGLLLATSSSSPSDDGGMSLQSQRSATPFSVAYVPNSPRSSQMHPPGKALTAGTGGSDRAGDFQALLARLPPPPQSEASLPAVIHVANVSTSRDVHDMALNKDRDGSNALLAPAPISPCKRDRAGGVLSGPSKPGRDAASSSSCASAEPKLKQPQVRRSSRSRTETAWHGRATAVVLGD